MTDPEEAPLGRWPVTLAQPVLWGHMDAYQHVNNTIYLRWFESARIAYFEQAGVIETFAATRVGPILARATVDFRIPLAFPDHVTVQATVQSIGTTSFVMGYRLTSAKHGGEVAAEGEGIVVMVNYDKGEKAEVSGELRTRIHALESQGR